MDPNSLLDKDDKPDNQRPFLQKDYSASSDHSHPHGNQSTSFASGLIARIPVLNRYVRVSEDNGKNKGNLSPKDRNQDDADDNQEEFLGPDAGKVDLQGKKVTFKTKGHWRNRKSNQSTSLSMVEFKKPQAQLEQPSDDIRAIVERMYQTGKLQVEPSRPKGWKLVKAAVIAIKFARKIQKENDEAKLSTINERRFRRTTEIRRTEGFYILPRSLPKKLWDYLVLLTIIYYALILPAQWYQELFTTPWQILDVILDIIIAADIIITFFTAIQMDTYIITDRRAIAKKYIGTYFFFDLLAFAPIHYFHHDLYLLKAVRLVRLKEGYSLLKRLFIHLPKGLPILNFLASLFIFISIMGYSSAILLYFARKSDDDWFHLFDKATSKKRNQVNLYILSSYYVITTITTVGYGEIAPKSTGERLFIMGYEFLGIVLVAMLHGQFVHMIETAQAQNFVRVQNEQFTRWLIQRLRLRNKFRNETELAAPQPEGTDEMLKKIEEYTVFSNAYRYKKLTSQSEFFQKLPVDLRSRLSAHSFAQTLRRFRTFFDMFTEEAFKMEIISGLRPKIFERNEEICSVNGQPKGLYFFYRGKGVVRHEGIDLFQATDGFYFGEVLLLNINSLVDLISTEPTRCLYISKAEILDICSRHPESLAILERAAFRRAEFFSTVMCKVDAFNSSQRLFLNRSSCSVDNLMQRSQELRSDRSMIVSARMKQENDNLFAEGSVINPDYQNFEASALLDKRPAFGHNAKQSFADLLKGARANESLIQNKVFSDDHHENTHEHADDDSENEDDTQDSDCDGDKLDQSFEVPLEEESMLDYKGMEDIENIVDYIQSKMYSLGCKVERLEDNLVQDLYQESTRIKSTIKRKGPAETESQIS